MRKWALLETQQQQQQKEKLIKKRGI